MQNEYFSVNQSVAFWEPAAPFLLSVCTAVTVGGGLAGAVSGVHSHTRWWAQSVRPILNTVYSPSSKVLSHETRILWSGRFHSGNVSYRSDQRCAQFHVRRCRAHLVSGGEFKDYPTGLCSKLLKGAEPLLAQFPRPMGTCNLQVPELHLSHASPAHTLFPPSRRLKPLPHLNPSCLSQDIYRLEFPRLLLVQSARLCSSLGNRKLTWRWSAGHNTGKRPDPSTLSAVLQDETFILAPSSDFYDPKT